MANEKNIVLESLDFSLPEFALVPTQPAVAKFGDDYYSGYGSGAPISLKDAESAIS